MGKNAGKGGSTKDSAGPVAGQGYHEASETLCNDVGTTFALARRIREDHLRDPVDALRDAETLVALQRQRVDELMARADHPKQGALFVDSSVTVTHNKA